MSRRKRKSRKNRKNRKRKSPSSSITNKESKLSSSKESRKQSQRSMRSRNGSARMRKVLVWMLGIPASIYGAYEALDNFDLLPTTPVFEPYGAPVEADAFIIRFSVTNRSKVFSLGHTTIDCHVEAALFSGDAEFRWLQLQAINESFGTDTVLHMACPFREVFGLSPVNELQRANISFVANYDLPWPWSDRVETKFAWDKTLHTWLDGDLR